MAIFRKFSAIDTLQSVDRFFAKDEILENKKRNETAHSLRKEKTINGLRNYQHNNQSKNTQDDDCDFGCCVGGFYQKAPDPKANNKQHYYC